MEFVKLLMSDDIQKEYSMSGSFVLNREYFRLTGEAAIEYYNQTTRGDAGLFLRSEEP